MKFAIVIPDGCADEPLDELGGKTPLEVANPKHINAIASGGRVGRVATVPKGFRANSDVATLSLLGYDPGRYYPGRAPLEAAAMDLELGPRDWVFRCNLVTVVDGMMVDYSASEIPSEQSHVLMGQISEQLGTEQIVFHPGISYRHLMVFKDADFSGLKTVGPHEIAIDTPFEPHLPQGKHSAEIVELMRRSQEILAKQQINELRIELDRANPANSIWLWGQGQLPKFDKFEQRFGLRGATITAVDLIRGISVLLGWDLLEVPGATGYIDTDYAAKGHYAVNALDQYDIVLVHVEAPDEVSHHRNPDEKIKAIKRIDEDVVAPLWDALQRHREHRILIMPDHATSCRTGHHADWPVPFVIGGNDVRSVVPRQFTEAAASKSDMLIDPGHTLMDFFLRRYHGTRQ